MAVRVDPFQFDFFKFYIPVGTVKIISSWLVNLFKLFLADLVHSAVNQYTTHTFASTRVLQKVLSLGSDYFSATFYQTYFYYKPSKYSHFTETHFCNL